MTFLAVLIALVIERVMQQSPQREHRWFGEYCRRLTRSHWTQWLISRPWGALTALLPLLILVAWLQSLFDSLGGVFGLAFAVGVLLMSLGPRDLREDVEHFIDARDAGDEEQANTIAQSLCLSELPTQEPRRSFAVARGVVVLALRRWTGPIFWFVAFGAVGAAAYRLIDLLADYLRGEDYPDQLQRNCGELAHLADWAPARITALGYAIAGNFDAVAHAWRAFVHDRGASPLSEAEALLAHTGLAALDTFPLDAEDQTLSEPEDEDTTPPPVVEDAMALVWRNLAIWVAIIAGGNLIAALA